MRQQFYPVAIEELRHVKDRVIVRSGLVSCGASLKAANNVRAIRTGEKRPPRKGEWYLSGAIPEAYFAPNALTTAYHIVKLVRVETIETLKVVGDIS